MAGAADLHHVYFGRILALFAAIFTILSCRTAAGFARTLALVLFVCHFNEPPVFSFVEGSLLAASLLARNTAVARAYLPWSGLFVAE